jgi:hypothetical protein
MRNDDTNRAAAVAGATPPPQAADIRDRWWWVEHSVWTERMPTRLEREADSRRWPNRWFAAQGLFSLEHGSCVYGQSR